MRKFVLLGGLMAAACWPTGAFSAGGFVSVVVECKWKGQQFVATGVEVTGVEGLDIAAGQGCPEVLAAIFDHDDPILRLLTEPDNSPLGKHVYVFSNDTSDQ